MPPVTRRRRANGVKKLRRRSWLRGIGPAIRWGLLAVFVVAVLGTGTWLSVSGVGGRLAVQSGEAALRLSARAGLRVEHVLVVGRDRVSRAAVKKALQVSRGMPLAAFDPHAAKIRLESLAWIRSVVVERQLPDTIRVRINERRPLALWQFKGRLALIDADGAVITKQKLSRYRRLPLVVGAGAPEHAAAIIRSLHLHPLLNARIRALVRVSQRRWDINFKNGVVARLPEKEADRALATLDRLARRERLLDRDVVAIDLRYKDRLVVRTTARPGGREEKSDKRHRERRNGTSKDT